jgi:hypothetical protein
MAAQADQPAIVLGEATELDGIVANQGSYANI